MRAVFTAVPRRWFCSGDGRVVVEHDARWSRPDGTAGEPVVIASEFAVLDGRVDRYVRHDAGLAVALAATGLAETDEVLP